VLTSFFELSNFEQLIISHEEFCPKFNLPSETKCQIFF
jgi:hypothetical protein